MNMEAIRQKIIAKIGGGQNVGLRPHKVRKLVKLGTDSNHEWDFSENEYILDIGFPSEDFFAWGAKLQIIKGDANIQTGSTNQPEGGLVQNPRFSYADYAYFSQDGEADALRQLFHSFGKLHRNDTADKWMIDFEDFLVRPVSGYIPAANSESGADVLPEYDGMSNECNPLKGILHFKPGSNYRIDTSIEGGVDPAIQGLENEVVEGSCNYALWTWCGCCVVRADKCFF